MPILIILAAIVCAVAGTGCGGRNDAAMPKGIECRLETSERLQSAGPVSITLSVRNVSDSLISLVLAGRPAEYVRVFTKSGALVWDSRYGQILQDILDVRALEPGEQWAFAFQWDERDTLGTPVTPGRYVVYGGLSVEEPLRVEAEPHEILITR